MKVYAFIIIVVAFIISSVSADDVSVDDNIDLNNVINEMRLDNPGEYNQFCVRGAALIVTGNSEEAEQYRADFGDCMKRAVKAYVSK